jgi:ABC-type branched-subunit amino acid transport system ATPase component
VLDPGRTIATGTPIEVLASDQVVGAYLGGIPQRATPHTGAARTAAPPTGARSGGRVVTALLEAREVTAGYSGVPAIRGVSLTVEPGEVVVLLGLNGAGKSTTLMALAGALPPSAGEVRWRGSATARPLHHRVRDGLSYLPEQRSVVNALAVADNIRLGGGHLGRALELFPELGDQLRRKAGLLSGGQQQMLALARALSRRPDCLLADELSLGLAPALVRRLLTAVRAAADTGIAVLIVEQHALQALELADRGYILARGRIQLSGPAASLQDQLGQLERSYLTGLTPGEPQ